jgi:hypothetical protein
MVESGLIEAPVPQNWIGIRMTDSPGNPDKAGAPRNDGTVRNAGRRHLLRAGMATAPVVMTVASRPVLALVCDSPSGFTSLNVSHPGHDVCTGIGPAGVLAEMDQNDKVKKFASIFPTATDGFGSVLSGVHVKLEDVIGHSSEAPWGLAQEIIAAYFNVANGRIPASILTHPAIMHIWHDYDLTGGYSPRAGAQWSYNEILAYLKTTHL